VIVEEVHEKEPSALDFLVFLVALWKAIPSILIILFLLYAVIG